LQCLTAGKIARFDRSRLDALSSVASFFVLALIALAVAYTYNRRARQADPGAERASVP